MGDFEFIKDLHEYRFRGQKRPGVSEILRAVNLTDAEFYTEAGRDRGTNLHDAIYLDHLGVLDPGSLTPECRKKFAGWERFKGEVVFEPLIEFCEKPMFHDLYLFGGCPDLPCILNGEPALLDVKSGGVERWAGYQLAGYELLLDHYRVFPKGIKKKYVIQLLEEAYKLFPFQDKSDQHIFLSALNVYNAQKQSKRVA